METLTSKTEPSFYCLRCDKWVDGIDDGRNLPGFAGFKQVLCDVCGGAIVYRAPTLWRRIRRFAFRLFAKTSSPNNK